MFYVYQLRASDEEQPFYIGKSFIGSKRFIEHLSEARNGGKRMKDQKITSVLSRGAEVLEEILFTFGAEAEANDKECELIALFGRRDNRTGMLTNHTAGGEGAMGYKHTEETRRIMSEKKKGNKINVGRARPDMTERFSKPVTAFTFEGQVVGHYSSSREAADDLGVPFVSISDVVTGKVQTAKSDTGIKYQFKYGTIVDSIESPTYNRGKGKVIQLTLDGDVVAVYDNAKHASEATGIAPQSIRTCVLGKAKTAGKFCWQSQSVG